MSRRLLLALGLSLGLGSLSAANPITWEFEGTARILEMGAASELADSLGVSLGAPVSGYLTYDGSALNYGGSEHGVYPASVLGFGLEIGDIAGESTTGLGCCTFGVNVDPMSGRGSIGVIAPGIPANVLFPLGAPAELHLIADTPGVIPNVSLPESPPPLAALRPFFSADWDSPYGGTVGTGLQIGFDPDSGWPYGWIVVELTSLEAVPEPGVGALLAVSLAAAALLRRRPSSLAPRRAASRPRSGRAGAAIRPGS